VAGTPSSALSAAQKQQRLYAGGVALATKALAHATVYACTGCAVLFYSIWKLSGAKDLKDFR